MVLFKQCGGRVPGSGSSQEVGAGIWVSGHNDLDWSGDGAGNRLGRVKSKDIL